MSKNKGKSFKAFKKELLANSEVRKEYDALEDNYQIAQVIFQLRTNAQMTQAELAEHIGTRQSNISRAEKGNPNVTWGTLTKIAQATGYELTIEMKPRQKKNRSSGLSAQGKESQA